MTTATKKGPDEAPDGELLTGLTPEQEAEIRGTAELIAEGIGRAGDPETIAEAMWNATECFLLTNRKVDAKWIPLTDEDFGFSGNGSKS